MLIGEIRNPVVTGNNVVFDLKGQNAAAESGLGLYRLYQKVYYDRIFSNRRC